ncbi:MAG TPA: glycerol-3-phosphate dehydrogenase C-terminal domain-containing protein [Prolixibacteraceae bacterium]
MGEDIVDNAILLGGLTDKECVTKNIPIHGYVKNINNSGHLYVYGSDVAKIKAMIGQYPELGEKLHPDLPYLKVEVIWAVRQEMARTVEDVLARRTRALLLDARASIVMAPLVAEIMAKELGYRRKWRKEQVRLYTEYANGYILN